MGILNAAIDRVAGIDMSAARDPSDEHWWYSGPVHQTTSGITVTPRIALGVSAVFQCVRLYAETLGLMNLRTLRVLEDRQDEIPNHPVGMLFDPRRGRPNPWQTGQQLRETMVAYSVLWGTGYAEIQYPSRGLYLLPLDSDTVEVEQLPTYRLRYQVQPQPGASPETREGRHRTLSHEQVWRVQGMAVHRFMPPALLTLARETVGHWLAMQRFNNLYFAQGARPSLFLSHPGKPSESVLKRLRQAVRERWTGLDNMHRVLIGEQGMKATEVGFSAKDSQLVEAWPAIVAEVGRWFNMPVHLLMHTDQPTFASVVEFGKQFKDLSLLPVARRLEASICRDLIVESDIILDHDFEDLLKPQFRDLMEGYALGVQNAIYSENEVRRKLGMPPVAGFDEPRRSVNQDRGAEPRKGGESEGSSNGSSSRTSPRPPRRLKLIVAGAAARVVHQEMETLRREAPKHSENATWERWLRSWYPKFAATVSEALELEPTVAREYCSRHCKAVLDQGLAAADCWETDATNELLRLTLEELEEPPCA